jgi:hypothetical protein
MGWLSRTFRPAARNTDPAEPSSPEVPPVRAAPDAGSGSTQASVEPLVQTLPTSGSSAPTGRYGPLVSVTRLETAPRELEWQLPLNGELYRLMPGSDRPDYSLFVLERPLHFYPLEGFDLDRVEPGQRVKDRRDRTMVRVHAMLLCARFVGQQLHPGMQDLAVNLAYVIDNSLARDAEVDFGKIQFAAIGFLSEGHAPRATVEPAEPAKAPAEVPAQPDAEHDAEPDAEPDAATRVDPAAASETEPAAEVTPDDVAAGRHTSSGLLDELATTLRRGIEQERGVPVRRMTAALTIDADHRLTGLSGNADGQAPVPSPDTFGRIAELLARLADLDGADRVAGVTLRVDGDSVTHDVTATHD